MRKVTQRSGDHAGGRTRPGLARVLLIALLVPLLAGILVTPATAGDPLQDALAKQKALQAKIEQQKQAVAKLRAIQDGLQADIATTATALAGVNADLAAMKKRVAKSAGELRDARAKYVDLTNQVKEWNATIARLDDEVAQQERLLSIRKSVLAARVRAAYETDRTSLLETLLSAQSFTDVISDVSSYMDYSAQDVALANQIERDRQLLELSRQMSEEARQTASDLRDETRLQRNKIDARFRDLAAARDELTKLERETARQLARQQRTFARARQSASQLKAAMNREIAAENALKSKIRQLVAQQAQGGNIPSDYNGTLAWPMAGVITQEYGCTGVVWEPPEGNCSHFHNGIDIAGPIGTPIRAAGDGVVVFAGPNPYDPYPKAWIVIIAHSTRLQTWYAHLNNADYPIPVRAGERVSQGQVIGYVGMTGRTSGPHLHWAVELDDSFRNPRLFL